MTTIEAGVATPYRANPLPFPLRRPAAALTNRTSATAKHQAAVAAMQGASVVAALPLLGTHHHEVAVEVAVATMKGATSGQPR